MSARARRPVHYAGAGTNALAFDCFYRDLRAHANSGEPVGKYGSRRYPVPTPLRHTDLRRVTCAECWGTIRKMASVALGLR
jgi:hypothetical protein